MLVIQCKSVGSPFQEAVWHTLSQCCSGIICVLLCTALLDVPCSFVERRLLIYWVIGKFSLVLIRSKTKFELSVCRLIIFVYQCHGWWWLILAYLMVFSKIKKQLVLSGVVLRWGQGRGKCDMKHYFTNSKHRHIGAKSSVLRPLKYAKMRFRLGPCPVPRWGSSRRSSDSLVGWVGDTAPHTTPHWAPK